MVRIDGYENDATGSDWFCYHQVGALLQKRKGRKLEMPCFGFDFSVFPPHLSARVLREEQPFVEAASVDLYRPVRGQVLLVRTFAL